MTNPETEAVLAESKVETGHSSAMGEVTVLEIAAELARRKGFVAKFTAGAMLGGIAIALLLPARFTAITRIMPPQQTQSSASLLMNQMEGGGGALAALTGEGLGLKNPSDLYIGLLKSRPVADAIIGAFDLQKVYRAPDMTAARQKLSDNTRIDSEKSGLIAISVIDRDKKRAAAIANAYVGQLHALTQSLAVTEASQRRLFYEQQLARAGEALVSAKLAFQQVQQTKGLVSLDAQAKAMIEGLAELRAKIAAKHVELQALRSYSTDRNPDVEIVQRELAALEAEASRLEQRNHTSDAGGLGLGEFPGAGREYMSAEHELAYRQTLYDLLIKQYDVAQLDEAKEAAVIQVVEPALEPERKSSPKRAIIVVVFTLFGFFAAAFYALAAMAIQRARRDPEIDLQFSALKAELLTRKVKLQA